MNPGATMAMTWVPEREGNWLFHCHIADAHPSGADAGRTRERHAATMARTTERREWRDWFWG